MSLTANVILNTFSILLLLVLMVYSSRDGCKTSRQRGLYLLLLGVAVTLLVLDTLSRFDGLSPAFPEINWTGNLILFLLTPLLPTFWVEYVYCQTRSDDKVPTAARLILLILNAANVLLVIASQFNGWYYTIDAANVYHRGPLYPLSHLITLIMLLWTYVVTYRNRHSLDRRVRFSLFFFPIPPLAGAVLQTLMYGYAFALVATVPSLLIVLLYAQDDSIYTDYLTGVGNRKKLESVLKEKVAKCSPKRTFSFIMLDIDHFKKINDSLGHETGDRVLKIAADLLKKSVRSNDYVTRYGGDEFCLILDVSSETGLSRVKQRILSGVEALNQSSAQPFRLSFSMGSQVYDFEEHLGAEEFLKRVDLLMYENKRAKALANAPESNT